MYKNGLVLGGGGIRGFGHLGFAQGLFDRNVQIDVYAGTSAGSMVGTFLADGYEPKEAFETFKELGLFSYSKVHWPTDGLFTLDGLKELLKIHVSVKDLEDLRKPLFVAASNLNTGKVEYRSSGPIADWIVASSSIPVLFSPKKIGNSYYADGGLLDNLPTLAIRELCENIIAVNVSPLVKEDNLNSVIKMAIRTFQISVDATSRNGKDFCDLYVEPEGISGVYLLDTKSTDRCYEMGYKAAMQLTDDQLEPFLQ